MPTNDKQSKAQILNLDTLKMTPGGEGITTGRSNSTSLASPGMRQDAGGNSSNDPPQLTISSPPNNSQDHTTASLTTTPQTTLITILSIPAELQLHVLRLLSADSPAYATCLGLTCRLLYDEYQTLHPGLDLNTAGFWVTTRSADREFRLRHLLREWVGPEHGLVGFLVVTGGVRVARTRIVERRRMEDASLEGRLVWG
ncbi:hypothetical protein B0O99DRAFT_269636 [Bisporella sp. PMI_857]|nr:hypothetical protein B0O99DRAFT_269636 [Bisporella sp. PMI_857]